MKYVNLLKKNIYFLSFLALVACSSESDSLESDTTDLSNCNNCQANSNKSIFNVSLDDFNYTLKYGSDFGEEVNTQVGNSAEGLFYNSDHTGFGIALSPIPMATLPEQYVFPRFYVMLPQGEEISLGNQSIEDIFTIQMLIDVPDYINNTTNHIYYDNGYNTNITINNVNLIIDDIFYKPSGDAVDVKGTFSSNYTTIADGIIHNSIIEFDIKDHPFVDGIGLTSNGIVGKWVNLTGCQTVDNTQSYFQFNADGTGRIFNADCSSACPGYGYFLNFDYTDNGNSVVLNYTSVSDYCGVSAPTPSPETLAYSISGNNLSIGGATWTK